MAQLNGNYLNGTNIAVLGTSAHETSEIMVYEHPLFGKVRMFIKNEKAWFCGMDIATSLQYSNTRDAFAELIDKVSGKGTWASNPYVFVYEFELID